MSLSEVLAGRAGNLSGRLAAVFQSLVMTNPDWQTLVFGPYLPDLPSYANPGATVARNVIPAERSYKPFRTLQTVTDALESTVLGGIAAQDASGNKYNYAGVAAKIYQVGASGVTDKSKSGGYSTAADEVWEFTPFQNRIIGTNFADPVQGLDIGAAGLFADQFTSTLTPKARHIATIREFLFLGNTSDATDGAVPYRTWWSASRDPTDMDPDAQTQSDTEDRPQAGWVQRIVGGVEYGLLFQQTAITRITYAGGETIFQFDSIDRMRGTPVPNSVIGHGRLVFFWSDEGFMSNDGTQSYPIGEDQVDSKVAAQFDVLDASDVSAAIDPLNKIVAWRIPGVTPTIFLYNWDDQKWAEIELDVDFLINSTTEGITLEGLDAIALDSSADTTLDANEAGGQTIISVADETLFDVGNTVRITLNDATIHQSTIDSIGTGTITIADALPSAADSGNRCVRTSLDALVPSLDSAQWKGGGLNFGAYSTDHKLGSFDGSTLTATLETMETELNPGQLSKLTKLRPLVDGGTITAAVAGRKSLQDPVVYDVAAAVDAIGEIGALNESRYHRIRVNITGTWEHAQGVQALSSQSGEK
ncbi:MAG: hypothetical protein ACR2RF_25085 [Geminicoccaceae bacterium]